MHSVAILGTSSDAGKTTVTMALCRLLADRGLRVAPFKAQNVSNNSAVTPEGREISRAQCLQAEAARIMPSHLFNPILLKSYGEGGVQVIVNGLVYKNQSIVGYYDEIVSLQVPVANAFSQLQKDFDLVIAEGAGSPVELNLLDRDLSNSYIASTFNTKNILVADIERGGVFAAIYGTLALMEPVMRKNLIGVVINKFRGDRRFFVEGERIIREQFGVPVLGVLPFMPLSIDMEDSQSLNNYQQRLGDLKIRIAVIAYPALSNYNDLDVFMADEEIEVEWVTAYRPLQAFDMVLLPGSKSVLSDLRWLKKQRLFDEIKSFEKPIFGICGGYQMLCRSLNDPNALESRMPASENGFSLIDDDVIYQSPKILTSGCYDLFDYPVNGYEIHCGRLRKYPLYFQSHRISGTHVHAIFDNDCFRNQYFKRLNPAYQGYAYHDYRQAEIQHFADRVGECIDIDHLLKSLTDWP